MQFNSGLRQALNVVALYIGSVIGAGFASGQEILQFFILSGSRGLYGVFLAALLFSYLGGLVMMLSASLGSSGYNDIYDKILGRRAGRLMDILSLIMLPGGLIVMMAGGGAIFSEHLGLPHTLGTLLIAIVTAAVLSRGLQGVMSANMVLVPLKVIVITVICVTALINSGNVRCPLPEIAGEPGKNWAWSAILYVSYNMVVPVAVLSSLGRSVSARPGALGGVLGGAAMGGVAGLVVLTGLCFYPGIASSEIPLLYISGDLGTPVTVLLGALIWMAILTTAIADAHGFASRFAESNCRKYRLIGIGTVLLALPVSSLKFSLLVKVLYPLFGYAGLILLFSLLFSVPFRIARRRFRKTI
ncbi:MAG: hypothetical protein ACOY31_12705 [Bacillota bacterium]